MNIEQTNVPEWMIQLDREQSKLIKESEIIKNSGAKIADSVLAQFFPLAIAIESGKKAKISKERNKLVKELEDNLPMIRDFMGEKAAESMQKAADELKEVTDKETFISFCKNFHKTMETVAEAKPEKSEVAKAMIAAVAETMDQALGGDKESHYFQISINNGTHLQLHKVNAQAETDYSELFLLEIPKPIDEQFGYIELAYRVEGFLDNNARAQFEIDRDIARVWKIRALTGATYQYFGDKAEGKGTIVIFGKEK